jgi:hypothetical protein
MNAMICTGAILTPLLGLKAYLDPASDPGCNSRWVLIV